MDGFIIGYKEKGITSFSFCNRIKYQLKAKKIGHSGTLVPNAEGLMVLGVNNCCKLMKFVNEDEKAYEATIIFGLDSNTLDMDGEITNDISMDVNYDELLKACEILKNKTTQLPPMVSSIRVDGRKLYEYARKNIEVEIKEREVSLLNYEIISDLLLIDNHYEIKIKLDVTKGYYIRSFARDLGKLLGGCAIVKELKRIRIADIDLSNAYKLAEISEDKIIKPYDFLKFDHVEVDDFIARLVKNGIVLDERQVITDKPFYVVNNDKIIALYEPIEPNVYHLVVLLED